MAVEGKDEDIECGMFVEQHPDDKASEDSKIPRLGVLR